MLLTFLQNRPIQESIEIGGVLGLLVSIINLIFYTRAAFRMAVDGITKLSRETARLRTSAIAKRYLRLVAARRSVRFLLTRFMKDVMFGLFGLATAFLCLSLDFLPVLPQRFHFIVTVALILVYGQIYDLVGRYIDLLNFEEYHGKVIKRLDGLLLRTGLDGPQRDQWLEDRHIQRVLSPSHTAIETGHA